MLLFLPTLKGKQNQDQAYTHSSLTPLCPAHSCIMDSDKFGLLGVGYQTNQKHL